MGPAAFPVDPNVRPTRRRLLAAAALGAGMGPGPAPAADDIAPPPGPAAFADAADLGAAQVPPAVRLVWLAGRRWPGRGAGWYERVPGTARLLPSLQSRDGAWWRLSPGERLDAAQFGAVADGVADDTAALQAMIDCALYEPDAPKNVLLPAGLYRTTDTLHIGYGDRYVTLRLSGEPMPHPDGHVGVTSMLLPDFVRSGKDTAGLFFVARRFSAAPHRLALRTTAGSSWGELHDARFGGGAPVALALTPGDGLVVARRTPGAAGAFHQIASARAESGQVVFTQPLPFSFSGDCPAFVRNGLA